MPYEQAKQTLIQNLKKVQSNNKLFVSINAYDTFGTRKIKKIKNFH